MSQQLFLYNGKRLPLVSTFFILLSLNDWCQRTTSNSAMYEHHGIILCDRLHTICPYLIAFLENAPSWVKSISIFPERPIIMDSSKNFCRNTRYISLVLAKSPFLHHCVHIFYNIERLSRHTQVCSKKGL